MGSGQMMLTIFAMVLLSMVILNINKGFYNTNTTMAFSRYNILATSVANSIIEDATGMRFDENTSGAVTSTSSLTSVANLGLDSGELSTNLKSFDDFDDYNCFRTNPKSDTIVVVATTNPKVTIIFKTICKVDYVSASNPSATSSSPTWHKRLRLWVYCPELADPKTGVTDTIKLSTVFSYWYFR